MLQRIIQTAISDIENKVSKVKDTQATRTEYTSTARYYRFILML
ncbi:MAG: hypothetical protein ACTS7E_03685 [Arsenophonus sp. NC-CH8-MAG3]